MHTPADISLWLMGWAILGVFLFVANWLRSYAVARVGARLTADLRRRLFTVFIRKELTWFENPDNSVSTLSLRLSHDCAQVRGLALDYHSLCLLLMSCLFVALGIALYFSWRVALVLISSAPLLAIGSFARRKVMLQGEISAREGLRLSAIVAAQAIRQIRTVL